MPKGEAAKGEAARALYSLFSSLLCEAPAQGCAWASPAVGTGSSTGATRAAGMTSSPSGGTPAAAAAPPPLWPLSPSGASSVPLGLELPSTTTLSTSLVKRWTLAARPLRASFGRPQVSPPHYRPLHANKQGGYTQARWPKHAVLLPPGAYARSMRSGNISIKEALVPLFH